MQLTDGYFAIKRFKPLKEAGPRTARDYTAPTTNNENATRTPQGPSVVQHNTFTSTVDHKKDFETEMEILRKLSGDKNEHLISLLAAYKKGDDYCLMFHWAKCDLKALWQYREKQPPPALDKSSLEWVLRQCKGIASALQRIHHFTTTEPSTNADGDMAPQGVRYGRHGDIKPQNLLLFVDKTKEGDRGILKITDFGLCRFNSDKSRTFVPHHQLPATPTYRPPECEMEGATISRSFDIWSLGCVFLEFITWYLGGWLYVEKFAKHRTLPNTLMNNWDTDQFYEIVKTADSTDNGPDFARVKLEVHQVCSPVVACTSAVLSRLTTV